MPVWLTDVFNWIALPSVARAIVVAQVASIMLTQFIKFQLPEWLTDKAHARRVRLFAVAVTVAVCLALWPETDDRTVKVVFALLAGISSPTIYWLAVKVLYHFWPWLDTRLSARPEQEKSP